MRKIQFLLPIVFLVLMHTHSWSQSGALGWDDFKNPKGEWFEAGEVILNPVDEKKLVSRDGEGVFINGKAGRITNLISKETFQDVRVTLEFMIPKGSNSGVYLQGRYEIQVFDSWGKENPGSGDCGGIYARYDGKKTFEGVAPLTNAARRPGEWQRLEIVFKGPRFNSRGEKIANARFKKVVLNGMLVHQNVDVSGPTASSLDDTEGRLGPLMLQGDHGPVAYRNLVLEKR